MTAGHPLRFAVLPEVGEDLVGMVGRGDRLVDPGDLAVTIDQIADTGRMGRRLVVGGAIGDADGLVGVAEQIVGEIELLLEGFVRLGGIETDAENDSVLALELLDSITESVAFNRSARCIGFRIPPQHNGFSPILIQGDGLTILGLHGEDRCRVSCIEHWHEFALLLMVTEYTPQWTARTRLSTTDLRPTRQETAP